DAVEEIGVLLVEIATVLENQRGNVPGRRGRVDATAKAVPHEARQIARMVEMGVCENDRIDAGGRDRQWFPVEFAQILHALEQAAIDQDALAFMFEKMLRTGHGAGRAK